MRFAPAAVFLLACVAGCGRSEEVRRYKAPKDPSWRMIGAIAPAKDATWFFKVTAPTERIAAQKDEILGFVRGLRIEEGEVRWTLPKGWAEEKGGQARLATFRFGDKEPKLEMSVSKLPGDGGGLSGNINRWRDQLGLDRLGDADVAASLEKISATGVEVQVADLIGPTRPPAGGPRSMARAPQPEAPRSQEPTPDSIRSMFAFDRPPGWKENPQPQRPTIFEFHVEEGGQSATVTFSMMGGSAGGLPANIDRWRGQVGLEPLGEQGVSRAATPLRFLGTEGSLVEAIGKERAILGVIALGSDFSMFLKLDGPPNVVVSQRETFLRVAQSFQMRGRHE